jgi:DNA polymerase
LRGITGRSQTIVSLRGKTPTALSGGAQLVVTVHPSMILRMPDRAAAALEYRRFVADLAAARTLAG